MGLISAYKTLLPNYLNTLILSHYFRLNNTNILPMYKKSLKIEI